MRQRLTQLASGAGAARCMMHLVIALALSGCDKLTDTNTFVERGLGSGQFDARLVPLKIGNTYLAIPRNYIDSFERSGKDGAFIKTGGVLMYAHWPTMEGRTPDNRDQIYSVQSNNGYHKVSMMIDALDGLRYPDDDEEFERGYKTKIFGFGDEKEPLGEVSREGSIYGYDRYIRKNSRRIAFDHGPTALILRKTNPRKRLLSYVYCVSHEFQEAPNYKPGESFRRNSVCNLYVHHRTFIISSGFVESNRLGEVAELESAIRLKVDEFIAAGEALHRQGDKAQ